MEARGQVREQAFLSGSYSVTSNTGSREQKNVSYKTVERLICLKLKSKGFN